MGQSVEKRDTGCSWFTRPNGAGQKSFAGYAEDLSSLPTLTGTITQDAKEVDPREVARWARIITSNRLIPVRWDEEKKGWYNSGVGGTTFGGDEFCTSADTLERKFSAIDGKMDGHVVTDNREITPSRLPEGTIAYFDPPYQDTTGYGNELSRAEVVEISKKWHEAGAWVVISEAEPLPELMKEGWHKVEITWSRKGMKRTFSKQQREWLTLSKPPKRGPGKPRGSILAKKKGKILR